MDKFAHAWGNWVTQNRVLTLVLTLALAIAAATGGQFLTFTNDYRVFFAGENKQLMAFEDLQNTYSKNDNTLFVIAPKDGEVCIALGQFLRTPHNAYAFVAGGKSVDPAGGIAEECRQLSQSIMTRKQVNQQRHGKRG